MKTSVLALFLLALAPTVRPEERPCVETSYGRCYFVHARYAIYADGDALWPVGTKRLLEATSPQLDQMLEKAGWEDNVLFGDFQVCPESPYIRGQKQAVCIAAYKNIRMASRK